MGLKMQDFNVIFDFIRGKQKNIPFFFFSFNNIFSFNFIIFCD